MADASKVVLVAGATGVIGQAALQHFSRLPDWKVVTISRRKPDVPGARFEHLALDLTDRAACEAALGGRTDITHVVYAALYEKASLVAGWRDAEQMATNLAMLKNTMEPLLRGSPVRHVSLLQGTKAYGVHIRPIAVPAKELWPRHPHDNFYWLQEDFLKEIASQNSFATTVFRPQVVFGSALGVAMNLIPVLGIYAALSKQEGRKFCFPGGPPYLLEAVDADLIALALAWAADAKEARDETFNITNGDVFCWQNLWPALAEALGVEPDEDEPLSMAEYLPTKEGVWQHVVASEGLVPSTISSLAGHSHHYADFCFAYGAKRPPAPALVSTIKLRQAGFAACIDTEAMFRKHIRTLQEKNILPRPH